MSSSVDPERVLFYEEHRHFHPQLISTPTDTHSYQVCQACGRAALGIEGHDQVVWCYGCGARFMGTHFGPHDHFSKQFGPYYRVSMTTKLAVDYPGDYRYDPFTGATVVEDVSNLPGRRQCAAQLAQLQTLRATCASR